MRVNIFDNGLQGKTGHHFDVCLKLAQSLQRRGHSLQVYGAAGSNATLERVFADGGIPYAALYSHHAYAAFDAKGDLIAALNAIAQTTADELSAARAADLNLFPTLKPMEFLGFTLAGMYGAMTGCVHAEPQLQGELVGAVWALAAEQALQKNMPCRLGAIDPVIGDFLGSYLHGLPVETFPIMLDGPARTTCAERPQTIGFFGSQREERGRDILAPLIEQLLVRGYGVVLHDSNGQFQNNGHAMLRVLSGFVADLQTEMLACDIVVCPMRRASYTHRLSGVACHAISAGLPLVMPAGTLSAARFHHLGSSICYQDHSMQGILQAILKMVEHYPRHAEAARQAADQWRDRHGLERFVDAVLPPSPPPEDKIHRPYQ